MKYVKDIGIKSKLAFERLKTAKHSQVVKVLDNYNKSLKINKLKIIKENIKDVRSAKRPSAPAKTAIIERCVSIAPFGFSSPSEV